MLGLLMGIAGVAFLPAQLFPPLGDLFSRNTYAIAPWKLPQLSEMLNMAYRGELGGDEYVRNARQLGFSESWAVRFLEANRPILGALDIITAERRKFISRNESDALLAKQGYSAERYELLRKLTMFYPTPQDLITWQAREVFEPDSVEKYGLEQELEKLVREPFYKAGMDDEQIRNYWVAHWQHPSWTQIREMLHRTDLTEADVWDWFRLVEVPPYWRDKFIETAYSPLTRVDIRRMYRVGVLDVEGVYKANREIGYNHEKATWLTDFTVRYESTEDKGITRAAVIKAFKVDLIALDELEEYLVRLEYSPPVQQFWIQMAVYEKASELTDELVNDWIDRFRIGELNLDELKLALDSLDLPAMYVEAIIRKERQKIAIKLKIPTKTDLLEWYINGTITEAEYVDKMRRLGFRSMDIVHYMENVLSEPEPIPPRALALVFYQRFLRNGYITEDEFDSLAAKVAESESVREEAKMTALAPEEEVEE